MTGFRNSVAMGKCPRCKQFVFFGYEGGSPFSIDLETLDQVQEVFAYAAKVTTYMLRHASDPAHMSVKYRIPKHIGSAPATGCTVHRAHPCKATPVLFAPTPSPVAQKARKSGSINSVTGEPTDGTMFIPNDGIEPPFDDGSRELPLAKCEKCGLDVTYGTGASLFIPGAEPWGCHERQYCPAAPDPDELYVHWSEYDSMYEDFDDRIPASSNWTRRPVRKYKRTTVIGDIDTIHEVLPVPGSETAVTVRRGPLPDPRTEGAHGEP